MRPNWFLAFPIDGSFVLRLPEHPKGLRRFHPNDVHLTLAFLGACTQDEAMNAWQTLDDRLTETPARPFEVSLGPVVAMGRPKLYTALSALPQRGQNEAIELIARFRDALTDAAGARRDKRPPKPHVTIARPRRRADDADRRAGLEWAQQLDLRHVTSKVDRVALYTWNMPRVDGFFRIVEVRSFG